MHSTGNNIESNDILDFSDNCENFDVLLNADQDYWTTRLGEKKPTVDYTLRMAGFTPAGFDFATGGVLKNGDRNKCVFNQADQTWYSWSGDLPYNVIAGSVPGEGWKVVNRNALTIAREALRRTYLEVGLNLVEGSFETGAVITSTTDVVLHEKTGKCYSGPIGNVPKGTNPAGNPNFIVRNFDSIRGDIINVGNITTIEAMSRDLSILRKFKTPAFNTGWGVEVKPKGGGTWSHTGIVDQSKAGTLTAGLLYDSVGRQFALIDKKISPQMLGAVSTVDCSSLLQYCLDHGKVFLEEDIRLTAGITLNKDNVNLDLNGFDIKCSFSEASVAAIALNSKKNLKIKNGSVTFITSGKFVYGNIKKCSLEDIDFTGGTLSLQFVGTYGDETTNITIKNCTHDGSLPTPGAGGFFSVDCGKYVRVINCTGKNGGEFIDINNLTSYVWIDNCISENYKQNHWDINSGWHVKITNSTIISTQSGLTSRPVWIGDYTGPAWPEAAPDRLKNSNYISIENCTFRISNMDYTEFMIFNPGTLYNPYVTEGRQLIMSIKNSVIDCDDTVYLKDKFKIGVVAGVIKWDIAGNIINKAAWSVIGGGKLGGCQFDAKAVGVVGNALDVKFIDGDIEGNVFLGWTGTSTVVASGGVIYANACTRTTFSLNKFKDLTPCYAVISSQTGGTNEYIENRFNMVNTDVDGVRGNPGDIIIYNASKVVA